MKVYKEIGRLVQEWPTGSKLDKNAIRSLVWFAQGKGTKLLEIQGEGLVGVRAGHPVGVRAGYLVGVRARQIWEGLKIQQE